MERLREQQEEGGLWLSEGRGGSLSLSPILECYRHSVTSPGELWKDTLGQSTAPQEVLPSSLPASLCPQGFSPWVSLSFLQLSSTGASEGGRQSHGPPGRGGAGPGQAAAFGETRPSPSSLGIQGCLASLESHSTHSWLRTAFACYRRCG